MKYKKAQTEIIGLVIIVIIITIAMLFYLSNSISNSADSNTDNIKKKFIDNELSMSFVQTLVRTTIPQCNDLSFDKLIKDCGLEQGFIRCSGGDSCEILRTVSQQIIEETLVNWGKAYSFKINFGGSSDIEPIVFETSDCSVSTLGRQSPGVQPIPYFPETGTAFLELAICLK